MTSSDHAVGCIKKFKLKSITRVVVAVYKWKDIRNVSSSIADNSFTDFNQTWTSISSMYVCILYKSSNFQYSSVLEIHSRTKVAITQGKSNYLHKFLDTQTTLIHQH